MRRFSGLFRRLRRYAVELGHDRGDLRVQLALLALQQYRFRRLRVLDRRFLSFVRDGIIKFARVARFYGYTRAAALEFVKQARQYVLRGFSRDAFIFGHVHVRCSRRRRGLGRSAATLDRLRRVVLSRACGLRGSQAAEVASSGLGRDVTLLGLVIFLVAERDDRTARSCFAAARGGNVQTRYRGGSKLRLGFPYSRGYPRQCRLDRSALAHRSVIIVYYARIRRVLDLCCRFLFGALRRKYFVREYFRALRRGDHGCAVRFGRGARRNEYLCSDVAVLRFRVYRFLIFYHGALRALSGHGRTLYSLKIRGLEQAQQFVGIFLRRGDRYYLSRSIVHHRNFTLAAQKRISVVMRLVVRHYGIARTVQRFVEVLYKTLSLVRHTRRYIVPDIIHKLPFR